MTDEATGPSPQEIEQQLAERILQELGPVAASFAQHIPQDKLGEIALALAQEQLIIGNQIIPAMIDPNILSKQPSLFIEIVNVRTGVGGNFQALKRLEFAGDDPGKALPMALLLSFLCTPTARGLLRMYGYTYRFIDPKPKDEPRIKLVRG